MKWKIFEKKADERQEKELLKIEHNAFWVMYFMLFISIIIQQFIMGKEFSAFIGEFIVFMVTSIFMLVCCMRKGVWTYQSRKTPGVKAYLGYSLIASAMGIFFGIFSAIRFNRVSAGEILIRIALFAGSIFALTFVAFLIVGGITRKREKMLADEAAKESEDEDEEE